MSNDVFEALPAVDADAMIRLRARLAAQASEAELIDVAYRTVDSPVGKLLLAATDVGRTARNIGIGKLGLPLPRNIGPDAVTKLVRRVTAPHRL